MQITPPGAAAAPALAPPGPRDAEMRKAAQAFEASFLSEMLKAAGFGKTPESFGGGSGEDQFGSFLIREQARQMTEAGGIGLAERIFAALKERGDAAQ